MSRWRDWLDTACDWAIASVFIGLCVLLFVLGRLGQ